MNKLMYIMFFASVPVMAMEEQQTDSLDRLVQQGVEVSTAVRQLKCEKSAKQQKIAHETREESRKKTLQAARKKMLQEVINTNMARRAAVIASKK